jgi:hypothetical protein
VGHEIEAGPANLAPTEVLNYQHPVVRAITDLFSKSQKGVPDRLLVQIFHGHIHETIRPIYTLNELQPVSVTFEKNEGSCSQRIACLEACSRAVGIPTISRIASSS